MSQPGHREVEHQIAVRSPAAVVYRLLADAENWPRLFPPTVHVDQVEHHAETFGSSERIRIWATANGEVKNWTSRRVLEPRRRRIEFRQEVSQAPVASMGGTWIVEAVADARSLVRLLHDYRAIDDDPESLEWIDRAVDSNSRTELAALKANVEFATGDGERLTFSFADSVVCEGSATDVYDFINEASLWRERLPHVARVAFTEETPGVQILEMDTSTKDGSVHTTKSVRVCFPRHRIVYKQVTLPGLMSAHTGRWEITEGPSAGTVTTTSQHTVTIREENITTYLGPDADLARAQQFIRTALGTNSMTTLEHARAYAESRT